MQFDVARASCAGLHGRDARATFSNCTSTRTRIRSWGVMFGAGWYFTAGVRRVRFPCRASARASMPSLSSANRSRLAPRFALALAGTGSISNQKAPFAGSADVSSAMSAKRERRPCINWDKTSRLGRDADETSALPALAPSHSQFESVPLSCSLHLFFLASKTGFRTQESAVSEIIGAERRHSG